MGRQFLSPAGAGARMDRGFTLVEVMISMSVTITVLLANLYLFNTVQKNLAFGRATTAATNLATGKIAEFKAMPITATPCLDPGTTVPNAGLTNYAFSGFGSPCTAGATTGDINPDYPGLVDEPFCSPAESRNAGYPVLAAGQPSTVPLCVSPGARSPHFVAGARIVGRQQQDVVTADGVAFTRSWVVSDVDLDGDANPEMVNDLVRVTIDVTWSEGGLSHKVSMSTLTTGRPQE